MKPETQTTELEALKKRLDALEAENAALKSTGKVQLVKPYDATVNARTISAVRLSNGETIEPGKDCVMSEADAAEFCDKTLAAPYQFSGEFDRKMPLGEIRRAKRA